jgi:hypothetical protein
MPAGVEQCHRQLRRLLAGIGHRAWPVATCACGLQAMSATRELGMAVADMRAVAAL